MLIRNAIQYGPAPPNPGTIVYDDDEFTLALSSLGGTGGTISLDPAGTYASGRIISLTPSSPLTIRSYGETPANFHDFTLNTASNIVFENIDIGDATTRSGDCILLIGANTGIVLRDCLFYGLKLNPLTDDYGDQATGTPGPDQPTRKGIGQSSGGHLVSPHITGCYFHDLADGIKPASIRGTGGLIFGNIFDEIYSDAAYAGWTSANPPHGLTISFNLFSRRVCLSTDYGNPHGDPVQIQTADAGTPTLNDVLIEGNIVWDTADARGIYQPFFLSGPAKYRYTKSAWNLRVSQFGISALSVEAAEGGYSFGDIAVRQSPGTGTGTSGITFASGGVIPCYVGSAVTEAATAPAGSTTENNSITANTEIAYQAVFDGPTFNPTSFEEVISKYKHKIGSALAALRDNVNYPGQLIVDRTLERPWVPFSPVVNADASVAIWSDWLKVVGGGANQSFVSTVPYDTASSESGAGATGETPAGAGMINEGQYVRIKVQTSAEAAKVTSGDFAIRGFSNVFSVTTAAALPFDMVANSGSAYSAIGSLGSASGQKRFVLLHEGKLDASPVNSWRMLGNLAGLWLRVNAGKFSFRLVSGSTIDVTSDVTADQLWHKHMIVVDLSQTSSGAVFQWYIDDVLVSTTGTIITTGSASFNPSTHLSSFGIGAAGDGSNTSSMSHGATLLWWGTASMAVPDLSDAGVRAKFNKFDLGSDGSGMFGVASRLYYEGDASEFNAGLPSKGAETMTLSKIAGTWSDV